MRYVFVILKDEGGNVNEESVKRLLPLSELSEANLSLEKVAVLGDDP
ncbi:MAG: hypothetical protein QXK12_02235 [Candidatus Nezhaarchaeales archaeon]